MDHLNITTPTFVSTLGTWATEVSWPWILNNGHHWVADSGSWLLSNASLSRKFLVDVMSIAIMLTALVILRFHARCIVLVAAKGLKILGLSLIVAFLVHLALGCKEIRRWL